MRKVMFALAILAGAFITAGPASAQCDSVCQAKCQAFWRLGGLPSVEACYRKWSRLNAMGIAAEAEALHNRGLAAWRESKYSEAEGLYKRALAIMEQALGANHSDVGQTLTNLANVYRDQGRYAEAEGLLKRALSITENANGANHPDVAWTLTNLALLYWSQGRCGDAEALHKRALAIRVIATKSRRTFMSYGSSIILFTLSTPSYTAT